jgi:photosystem II stability/assembly factor-like uncharacterized protein
MKSAQDLRGLREWRNIGPMRGGRVLAVAGDPSDIATFYFGGAAGGVFKTIDAGTTWRAVSDGYFKTGSVGALEVAPADPNVIYAGMGETTIRIDVSHGDGVYKSTDAGNTWRHMGLAATRHIGKVRTHPRDANTVYVAALGHAFGENPERGVYKSTDGGETWRHVLFVSEKAGAVDLSIDQTNPRFIYVGVWEAYRKFWQISSGGPDSGLWMSSDGGESWENISGRPGLPKGTWGKIAVAASPAKTGRVWALIEHRTDGGLYRSDDFGKTWEKVSDNQHLLSRAWYYTHLTADPVDAERVYVNNLAFWRSDDGGRNFVTIETPHGDNHDIWIDPKNNRRMIQGNDGGANVSLNGAETWSTIYNQPTAQFYHLATDNRVPYNIFGTQQDNSSLATPSRTFGSSIRWADSFIAGSGESGYIQVHPTNPDIVYVGAIGSSPGGGNALQRFDRSSGQLRLVTTWPEVASGDGAKALKYRFNWTYPILLSPHDPNTIYIGGNLVFRSTNEGQSWEPISPDLSRAEPWTLEPTGGPVNLDAIGAETYATVFSLAESPIEKGLLWAGSDDGVVHITRDGGATWQNITPAGFPEWSMVSGLEPSPFDAGTCYMACTRYKIDDYAPYLYKTTDFGATWTRIDSGIGSDDFTRVIRADKGRQGLLFAGTETGVYVSFNDGAEWHSLQNNLPATPVHEILIKDNDLIVGTHGRSIWIMDDITPLRELPAELGAAYIAPAGGAIRTLIGVDWTQPGVGTNYFGSTGGTFLGTKTEENTIAVTHLDTGANPVKGAVIAYYLADVPGSPITLSIKDGNGNELRSFASKGGPGDDKGIRMPARKGWNRFVWDLRINAATKIKGNDPASQETYAGPRVTPGSYPITLTVDGTVLNGSVTVIKEPGINTPDADIAEQFSISMQVHELIDTTTKTVNSMRDLRAQLSGWAERAAGNDDIVAACNSLKDRVLEIEKTILVPDLRPGWADSLNQGTKLLAKITSLPSVLEMGEFKPTDAAVEVYRHVNGLLQAQFAAFITLKTSELPALNARLAEAGYGSIA